MSPDQFADLMKSLGVAAPLVVVLLYLLRVLLQLLHHATEERKTITSQFVDAMKTTAATSAVAQQEAASSLRELAASLRDLGTRSSDEHNRIVDALGKFHQREHPS